MTKPRRIYFEKEDILHLVISDDPESDSIELSPNITAELNENGEFSRIEILNASAFIQDAVRSWIRISLKGFLWLTKANGSGRSAFFDRFLQTC